MKKNLFLILFIFGAHLAYSQAFEKVDSIVATYPRSFWSPEKLAKRINADFDSDSARARAIFSWIAKHVAYDIKKYKELKSRKYNRKISRIGFRDPAAYRQRVALATLRKKKGVCEDYATLFQRLGSLCGLECAIVLGTAKTRPSDIGRFPGQADHAWNAVKVKNEWRLIDVTWGAGVVNEATEKFRFRFNGSYFFTPADLFFLNHFPHDSKWRHQGQSDSVFAALPLFHRLDHRVEILSPEGVINCKGGNHIQFRIKADQTMNWKYYYSKSKSGFVFHLDHVFSDGIATFSVPPPHAMKDYLTIYCDGTPLATFKIKAGIFSRIAFAGGTGR